jgi:hypothetical protein
MLTELLPGNSLVKSVTIYYNFKKPRADESGIGLRMRIAVAVCLGTTAGKKTRFNYMA